MQSNGGDDLIIPKGATTFTFNNKIEYGATYSYNVTVKTQPTNPSQTCIVTNGVGFVTTASVADINISCPERISFDSIGTLMGIFDPSLEGDGLRVWMSYSAVEPPQDPLCKLPSDPSSVNMRINTRLAFSDDNGNTWSDFGIVNQAESVCTPFDAPLNIVTWEYEVSTVVRDPSAPDNERWKLFMHRYLLTNDGNPATDDRSITKSWIGMRTASDPAAVWSPERKLFVGSSYDETINTVIGEPEVRLNNLDPALSDCIAFSEPGALGTDQGIYLALGCFTADTSKYRTILLKGANDTWQYKGALLTTANATSLALNNMHFSGSELFSAEGRYFYIATPISEGQGVSCMVFEIEDLNSAALVQDTNGTPKVLSTVTTGNLGNVVGPCGYDPLSSASGILYGEHPLTYDSNTNLMDFFQIMKSYINYP